VADHTMVRRPLLNSPADYLLAAVITLTATSIVGVWLTGQLAGLLFRAAWPATNVSDTGHIIGQSGR